MNTQTTYSQNGKKYLQTKTKAFKKKDHSCRCCGEANQHILTIHHIIPRQIGTAFKVSTFLKCPTVVLCQECHNEYERTADIVKDDFALDLGIDLNTPRMYGNPINSKNNHLSHVRKAARAIMAVTENWSSSIGVDKRVDIILDYLEAPYYTTNDLIRLSELDTGSVVAKIPNPEYKHLGEELMQYWDIDKIKRFWIGHWHKYEAKRKNEVQRRNYKYTNKVAVAA